MLDLEKLQKKFDELFEDPEVQKDFDLFVKKKQIEENQSILKTLELHGKDYTILAIKQRIINLYNSLKLPAE